MMKKQGSSTPKPRPTQASAGKGPAKGGPPGTGRPPATSPPRLSAEAAARRVVDKLNPQLRAGALSGETVDRSNVDLTDISIRRSTGVVSRRCDDGLRRGRW
jgi:hypothetical protein